MSGNETNATCVLRSREVYAESGGSRWKLGGLDSLHAVHTISRAIESKKRRVKTKAQL